MTGCRGLSAEVTAIPRLAIAVIALATSTQCVAQKTENPLLRKSAGTIEYRSIDHDVVRGTEQWTLMVHSDGSRTLNARMHNLEAGTRTHIIQRVDADFHPLDAVIQRWVGDNYRGIGLFTIKDNVLTGLSRGAEEEGSQEVSLGQDVTLLSHAVAADAWLGIPANLEAQREGEITAYSVELKPSATPPFLGTMIHAAVEWVGRETIEVPAGRFDTTHLRLADRFDIWIFGPDRTMARMLDEKAGREYVLVDYSGDRSLLAPNLR